MWGIANEILIGIGVILAALFYGWRMRGKQVEQKESKRKLDSVKMRERKQKEAETQDGQSLVDRISRDRIDRL